MDRKVKALRIELGLSQAELAHHLGLSRTTISGWESGHWPTPRWLWLAAAALIANQPPHPPSDLALQRASNGRRLPPSPYRKPALKG